jgi:hypothetical protein
MQVTTSTWGTVIAALLIGGCEAGAGRDGSAGAGGTPVERTCADLDEPVSWSIMQRGAE